MLTACVCVFISVDKKIYSKVVRMGKQSIVSQGKQNTTQAASHISNRKDSNTESVKCWPQRLSFACESFYIFLRASWPVIVNTGQLWPSQSPISLVAMAVWSID